jgi:hypothetical protein
MIKDLQELISEREMLCFMLIEAEGEEYYDIERKLEELENEIFLTKEITEENDNEE